MTGSNAPQPNNDPRFAPSVPTAQTYKPVNWFRWLVGTVALVLVAIVVAGVLAIQGDNDGLNGQINSQNVQMRAMRATVQENTEEISSLNSQISSLNQPQDPLSAYNDICQQQEQNNSTGETQTYYFPCTNNAQTTPQPGS